jgi:CTP synthase (UTP-ammonia lyase)
VPGTRAAAICGPGPMHGYHVCGYGLAPDHIGTLEAAGLVIGGHAPDAGVEIVELPGHPFFMATLFQPQGRADGEPLHPLLTAFADAVAGHRRTGQIRGT